MPLYTGPILNPHHSDRAAIRPIGKGEQRLFVARRIDRFIVSGAVMTNSLSEIMMFHVFDGRRARVPLLREPRDCPCDRTDTNAHALLPWRRLAPTLSGCGRGLDWKEPYGSRCHAT